MSKNAPKDTSKDTQANIIKREVLQTAKTLYEKGLVEGTSGNVSARLQKSLCITPSSLPYSDMTLSDLVLLNMEGEKIQGKRNPSSESVLHLSCYRQYPEVGGVVHSHPVYASAFALNREPIPVVIEEAIVYLGGDIGVTAYKQTGSEELAVELPKHLGERSAVLMANHGLLSIGKNADDALHAALVVERTAKIVWAARAMNPQTNAKTSPRAKIHKLPQKTVNDFMNAYQFVRSEMWKQD